MHIEHTYAEVDFIIYSNIRDQLNLFNAIYSSHRFNFYWSIF